MSQRKWRNLEYFLFKHNNKISMARKNIDLTDKVKEKLSIQAIKKGTNLKNYIEWFLDKLANGKVELKD